MWAAQSVFSGSYGLRPVRFSLMRDDNTQISHIAGDLSMNTSPWNKDRIVEFEITKGTREAVAPLMKPGNLHSKDFLFRSRVGANRHISTRQYNRIFQG